MQIVSLHIYPIKGMAGISLTQAQTAAEGFIHDRRWMLVNAEGTFLSQRSHRSMALFEQSISKDHLQIKFDGKSIKIPLNETSGYPFEVQVFDNQMLAREVQPTISQWFSEQLDTPVRLVRHCPVTQRIKTLKKGPENTAVSFADGYPYLILGTASLKELNRRLAMPIPMNRFRPNIVVSTDDPHIEDSWEKLQIGTQDFMVIKPCARCEVTTIDQSNATRSKEPLKTLASYRREGNKVNFGANAISFDQGLIKLGDAVLPRNKA